MQPESDLHPDIIPYSVIDMLQGLFEQHFLHDLMALSFTNTYPNHP